MKWESHLTAATFALKSDTRSPAESEGEEQGQSFMGREESLNRRPNWLLGSLHWSPAAPASTLPLPSLSLLLPAPQPHRASRTFSETTSLLRFKCCSGSSPHDTGMRPKFSVPPPPTLAPSPALQPLGSEQFCEH